MKIEILFPEFCNLFGDVSNMRYLQKCLPEAEFIETPFEAEPRFLTEDMALVYLGPMTEQTQERVIEKFLPHAGRIEELMQQGKAFLFTGNALEILGEYIQREDGSRVKALDIFPMTAKQDMMHRHNSTFLGTYQGVPVMGFKSQFTLAYPNKEPFPFGLFEVKKGTGLNPKSGMEGILYQNFFGTYLLGPLLVLNPPFTKDLLRRMGAPDASLALEAEVTAAYEQRLKDFQAKT